MHQPINLVIVTCCQQDPSGVTCAEIRCTAVSSADARLTDAAGPVWCRRPGGEDDYHVSRTGQSAKGSVGADDNGFEVDPLDDLDDYDLEQGPLLDRCDAAMHNS